MIFQKKNRSSIYDRRPYANSDDKTVFEGELRSCFNIATIFNESETALVNEYIETVNKLRNRKFTLMPTIIIAVVFPIVGAYLSFSVLGDKEGIAKTIPMLVAPIASVIFGLTPMSVGLAKCWKVAYMLQQRTRGIIAEWKLAVRNLNRAGHSVGEKPEAYTMLTTHTDEYISAFEIRNTEWKEYVRKNSRTKGE